MQFLCNECHLAKPFILLSFYLFCVTSSLFTEKILIKSSPPFSIFSEGKWSGLSVELWEEIATENNIKVDYQLENLQGILEGIRDEKAVVAVGAISMTFERETEFDFTHPFYTTRMGLLRPNKDNSSFSMFEAFFSIGFLKASGALVLIIFIFGSVMWLFEKNKNSEQFGGSALKGLGSGFWWSAVTMTTVGYGDKFPKTFLGKVTGMVWMFVAIIVISGFTAAITTSLTVNSLDGSKKGLWTIKNKFIGAVRGSTAEQYLLDMRYKVKAFKDLDTTLKAVESKKVVAMVHDLPVLRYTSDSEKYQVIPIEGAPIQYYSFPLPKNSPYREAFNRSLLRIIASEKWQQKIVKYLGNIE